MDNPFTAFVYFVVLIFMIPSFIISLYALLIYKLISKIKVDRKAKVLIPPAMALVIAVIISQPYNAFPNSAIAIKLFGYIFTFIYGTEMAAGMITPIFIFESRTTYRQRKYMILAFSVILAILFMRAFATVMGTPSPSVGLLGLLDYRTILKLGKIPFHFISAILPYLEMVCTSTIFYTICYGLILLRRVIGNGNK